MARCDRKKQNIKIKCCINDVDETRLIEQLIDAHIIYINSVLNSSSLSDSDRTNILNKMIHKI